MGGSVETVVGSFAGTTAVESGAGVAGLASCITTALADCSILSFAVASENVKRLGLLDGLVGILATLLRLASHFTVALNPGILGLGDHAHSLSPSFTVARSVINPPPALTRERLAVTEAGLAI
jgi:hypothetical protein